MTISPDDAADAALAYALWDSEHTVRMRADAIEEYIARAKSQRHWLKVHGYEVVAVEEIERLREHVAQCPEHPMAACVKALQFYQDEWIARATACPREEPTDALIQDAGDRARAALANATGGNRPNAANESEPPCYGASAPRIRIK